MWSTTSRFLNGIYEPLTSEIVIDRARIEGTIPDDLNGTLYRNGSNARFRPNNVEAFHWFDGDGMVHAFTIADGHAGYRNKWVQTEGLAAEQRAGRALYNGLYGNSGVAQPATPVDAPLVKQVANVGVVELGGKVFAVQEAGRHWYELDPDSLDVRATFDFGGNVDAALTAHPHLDPSTGDMLFYVLDADGHTLDLCRASSDGRFLQRHRVQLDTAPWIHDFIFTEHYYIVFLGPIGWHTTLGDYTPYGTTSWTYHPERTVRILLVDRATGDVQWFDDGSYQTNHYLNAYEENGVVIVDGTMAEVDPGVGDVLVSDFFPFPISSAPSPFSPPFVWRWRIDPLAGRVTHERIGEFIAEFPRPNETRLGQAHRYGYFAGTYAPKTALRGFNALIKHDYHAQRTAFQYLSADTDLSPGEPIFVPRAGASAEDDGYVLAVWWDPHRNASEMVIHDAAGFEDEPIARIKLDHHVPLGFHGNWVQRAG